MAYTYAASNLPQPADVDHSGVLVNKRTILSNPGTKVTHSLYYSALNTVVQPVETVWAQGRFSQTLSSPQFGGTSTILIPNGSFISTTILNLKMQAPLAANMVLNRGWMFAAIKNISYLFGSSSTPQVTISGPSLYHLLLAQTESVLKRSEMLSLGGQETFGSSGNTYVPEGNIILPTPWSVFAGKDIPYPFDTNILQNPIQILIELNPLKSFCSGIGVASWPYYGYARALVSIRMGDLTDRSAGLRTIMQNSPELSYGYPTNYVQSFNSSFVAPDPNSASTVSINLIGFINADLLGIIFGVQKATRLSPATAGDIINPLILDDVEDITVKFNGNIMHYTPGQQHLLTNMTSCSDPSYIQQSEVNLPSVAGTGPFTSQPRNVTACFIDFAQFRSYNFFKEYENCTRIASNTLTLELRTPNVPVNTQMVINASFVYNGIIDIKNGESSIFFS